MKKKVIDRIIRFELERIIKATAEVRDWSLSGIKRGTYSDDDDDLILVLLLTCYNSIGLIE